MDGWPLVVGGVLDVLGGRVVVRVGEGAEDGGVQAIENRTVTVPSPAGPPLPEHVKLAWYRPGRSPALPVPVKWLPDRVSDTGATRPGEVTVPAFPAQ
ncbi:hypothetical protein GCM10027445_02080 [Amycolatopsis endophytica]